MQLVLLKRCSVWHLVSWKRFSASFWVGKGIRLEAFGRKSKYLKIPKNILAVRWQKGRLKYAWSPGADDLCKDPIAKVLIATINTKVSIKKVSTKLFWSRNEIGIRGSQFERFHLSKLSLSQQCTFDRNSRFQLDFPISNSFELEVRKTN